LKKNFRQIISADFFQPGGPSKKAFFSRLNCQLLFICPSRQAFYCLILLHRDQWGHKDAQGTKARYFFSWSGCSVFYFNDPPSPEPPEGVEHLLPEQITSHLLQLDVLRRSATRMVIRG
jgi:hypothetical protein